VEVQVGGVAGPPPTGARPGLRARGPLTAAELQNLAITSDDFGAALLKVQPSVRREGFSTKPDVTWEDVVRSCSLPKRKRMHRMHELSHACRSGKH
jgi:hypothetical protein